MRTRIRSVLALLLLLLMLAGCAAPQAARETPAGGGELRLLTEAPDPSPEGTDTPPETEPAPETEAPAPALSEDGEYTAPEDVAAYLRAYGHLPENFITKSEARALGWRGGDLWPYAPGKSIGGDRYGNYEGLLPEGSYRECDVNYSGGKRRAERLIYSADGRCYYSNDHYESFTELE